MGRPKIKTIETAIDLDKVDLEKEEQLPVLDEATEKRVKQDTKEAKEAVANKRVIKHTRSKRFSKLEELLDKNKEITLSEAVDLVKQTSNVKFDSTVEAHINLRLDLSKQGQQIRTTAKLPHPTGKKVRVLVFGAKAPKEDKQLGVMVGSEDTLSEIEKGKADFDKVVATPEWMPKLAKVAKILGPKGLMPNPKSGTVTTDPEKTMKDLSSGMIELKTENSPIIHARVGKTSFKAEQLEENIKALIEAVRAAKPTEVKKELIKSAYLTTTMGPSIRLDLTSLK